MGVGAFCSGRYHHGQRATIAAYVRAAGREAWLAPPTDPARRSGPWPSGRTWYLASRFLAAIDAVSPGNRVLQGAALAGLVAPMPCATRSPVP